MSNPHYIRILVTHQPTYEYLERFLQRRLEGLQAARSFAKSVGATAYRLNFEDRPFSFDDFDSTADHRLWKRHSGGGFCLREKVPKALKAKRDELDVAMKAIRVPGQRTLTQELFGDIFVLHHGQHAYYLRLDNLGASNVNKFIISYPVADKADPLPEKAQSWGVVIKESRYHELMENAAAAAVAATQK